jgi:hypothetical protein
MEPSFKTAADATTTEASKMMRVRDNTNLAENSMFSNNGGGQISSTMQQNQMAGKINTQNYMPTQNSLEKDTRSKHRSPLPQLSSLD